VGKGKKKGGKASKSAVMPKSKCCISKDRCKRCPLRMLKEGTLPEGYTVKKRKLVKVKKKVGTLPEAA
jgi:hypothetical protein